MFLFPRHRLIYLKLVQVEWNTKQKNIFYVFISETPPNLSKISASRVEYKTKNIFYVFISETPPNLFKKPYPTIAHCSQ